MFKAIVLLALVAAAAAQTRVAVRPCPGGHTEPHYFESTDCSATRCRLVRGQIFAGRGSWTTTETFNNLDVNIQATVFGIPLDMPLEEDEADACRNLEGTSCPIAAGTTHTWLLRFHIAPALPQNVEVVIQSEFMNL